MRLSPNAKTVTNSDGGVLLDLSKGNLVRLNATAAVIVDLLVHGSTEEHIVSEISARCSIDPKTVSSDVQSFLDSLKDLGLLEEHGRS